MTSGIPPSSVLQAALQQSGLSRDQLWVDYIGLGGAASPEGLGRFLSGVEALGRAQYDMLAQALNERYMDMGMDHPVPYYDELG